MSYIKNILLKTKKKLVFEHKQECSTLYFRVFFLFSCFCWRDKHVASMEESPIIHKIDDLLYFMLKILAVRSRVISFKQLSDHRYTQVILLALWLDLATPRSSFSST